ncbi:MAG: type II secretion system protein [Planctomycetaceae bacterium]
MNTKIAYHKKANRKGFTLVELVVVILVMGIVAAVAAPKMFSAAGDARTNTTKQSLTVIRNAIQLYRAQTGVLPGEAGSEADLKADLGPYLQGPFPTNQIPEAANDASISVVTAGTPLTVSGAQDWKYDNVTGECIINTTGLGTY